MGVGRPSHGMVVAYLALFVALTGTATAVSKIGSNELKKGAVKTKKIADFAVTESKLANGAVSNAKLADAAVTESKLAEDSVSGSKIQQAVIGTGKLREGAVENSKIADSAVTGSKVADGSLALGDIAQLAVNVSTADLGSIPTGGCAADTGISVPGLQAGDDVLVFPRSTSEGWNAGLILDGYGPGGASSIAVVVCNPVGAPIDPGPLPLTVLGFR